MSRDRESQLGTAVQAESEEQDQEPIVAPGDPEAPVGPAGPQADPGGEPQQPAAEPEEGPSRPHGDELAEEAEAQTEHPVVRDLEELTARAEKADEYLGLAQRTKADFENFRKRAARDAAAAQERGVVKLAKELLPAVDNLDRALAATQDGQAQDGTLASGVKLVHAEVLAALGRMGIEPYSPEGEPFDPHHHEAVAQQPVEGAESGTIVTVYQAGYRYKDEVLRAAKVVVAA
jgi:molecular chaperone GrpE